MPNSILGPHSIYVGIWISVRLFDLGAVSGSCDYSDFSTFSGFADRTLKRPKAEVGVVGSTGFRCGTRLVAIFLSWER